MDNPDGPAHAIFEGWMDGWMRNPDFLLAPGPPAVRPCPSSFYSSFSSRCMSETSFSSPVWHASYFSFRGDFPSATLIYHRSEKNDRVPVLPSFSFRLFV